MAVKQESKETNYHKFALIGLAIVSFIIACIYFHLRLLEKRFVITRMVNLQVILSFVLNYCNRFLYFLKNVRTQYILKQKDIQHIKLYGVHIGQNFNSCYSKWKIYVCLIPIQERSYNTTLTIQLYIFLNCLLHIFVY